MNKVIPLDDYVLIEIIDVGERTFGGIIIPEKARDNQRDARLARVLAAGPGRTTEYGARIEVTVKPGEMVLIPRVAGCQVEHESSGVLRILRCVEILAKVEETRIVSLT